MIPISISISSALFFAIMNILITYKLGSIDPLILLFFRGAVAVVFLGPFIMKDVHLLFTRPAIPVHLRSVSGALAVLCTFWTLQNTSSLHASFLASLAPLFLMIMIFIFNGNTLNKIQLCGLLLVVFGTLVVAGSPSAESSSKVWILGTLGAFLSALAMLFLKQATAQFSPQLIVFNFSVLFLIIGLPGVSMAWPDDTLLLWLWLMGGCSVLGQVFMTVSYKQLDPQLANAFGRTLLLWVGGAELLLFGRIPGITDSIGYLFAVVGLLLVTRRANPNNPLPKIVDDSETGIVSGGAGKEDNEVRLGVQ